MKFLIPLSLLALSFSALAHVPENCKFGIKTEDNSTIYGYIIVGEKTATAGYDTSPDTVVEEVFQQTVNGQMEVKRTQGASFARSLEIDISTAQSARETVLNPERNNDDLSGASITTFYDADGKVLARIGQIGWGAGLCESEN